MPPQLLMSQSMTGCNSRSCVTWPGEWRWSLMTTDDPHVTTCDQMSMSGPGPLWGPRPLVCRVPLSADAEPDVRSGAAQSQWQHHHHHALYLMRAFTRSASTQFYVNNYCRSSFHVCFGIENRDQVKKRKVINKELYWERKTLRYY